LTNVVFVLTLVVVIYKK